MHTLLDDIKSFLTDIQMDLEPERFLTYQTVLERSQIPTFLKEAVDLWVCGSGSPEQIRFYADDTKKQILILRPPPEEIPGLLSYTGACLENLQLFATSLRYLHLPNLFNLKELNLSQNRQLASLSGLEQLTELEYLDLSDTRLSAIPGGIATLNKLTDLGLANLALEDIPEWFPKFHLLINNSEAVNMRNLRIRKEVFQAFNLSSKELCAALSLRCGKSIAEYKVILLGDAESGKTLTLHRLMKDDKKPFEDAENELYTDKKTYAPAGFDHNSTPGVTIEKKDFDLKKYNLGDEQIRIHFWDFGGQDILHLAHSVFLTDKTLYVILLNTRNDTQDARARYWLRYLQSHKPDCPVLLILNKIDQNPNASVDEYSLRKSYPNIRKILPLSSLKYNRRRFAEHFTIVLLKELLSLDNLRYSFPAKYEKVRLWLEREKKPYIEIEEFQKKCWACDEAYATSTGTSIDSAIAKDVHESLLEHIKQLGLGINLPGVKTDPYIILRPKWITNAIYIILMNKPKEVTNGLLSQCDIQKLLAPDYQPGTKDTRQQNYPNEVYPRTMIPFVLQLMNLHGLSFSLNETEQEFIPMLCCHNTPKYVENYIYDRNCLHQRFIFDELPNITLFRLLIKLFSEADQSNVWLTGAEFQWYSSEHKVKRNCKAVVLSENHHIDIYLLAENLEDGQKTLESLWNDIRSEAQGIHVTRFIGLRINGQTEYFDYYLLEQNRKHSLLEIYSRRKQGLLYIDDILAYRDSSNDRQRQKLLDDIIAVCQQIQCDCHFYDCKEDYRNLYITNSLKNRGYITATQVPSGYGKNLAAPGEIDIEIKSAIGAPISLIEALNYKFKAHKTNSLESHPKQYWYDHLNKLVINYNQDGFRYLFLITYIDDPSDTFDNDCNRLIKYLTDNAPVGYSFKSNAIKIYPNESQPQNIQVYDCIYCTDTRTVRVYHILVRFWNPPKKESVPNKAPQTDTITPETPESTS